MKFRQLSRATGTFVLFTLLFLITMQPVGATSATVIPLSAAETTGTLDCVTQSQVGQQTLRDAMTALLGDDPAGIQFGDDTAFVANELLVGSTPADITAVTTLVNGLGFDLFAIGEPLVVGDVTVQRFTRDGVPDNHAGSIRRIFCEIAAAQQVGTLSNSAFAEPNYRISASQWWAAGSRWRDDNLSEYMLEHSGDTVTDYFNYTNQWAWGEEGINLQVAGSRAISQTGVGTRVVLFDSSPFAETGHFTLTANVAGQNQELFAIQTTERFTQTIFANSAFPDHGIFVAGLAHHVAPAANLELVRVLGNDDGQGTLADLLAALAEFYARNSTVRALDLHGTVMNLSIGVHHPITPTFSSLPVTATFGLPNEVLSLKQFLRYGYDNGATIVAAAGNDFAFGRDDSPWAETPADYDFVISVGGSTSGGNRSCFSNNGELFAPAGDGISDCGGSPSQSCATTPTNCIVSVIHDAQGATNANFGYWVGSSFAAPQVSGLVALIQEALTLESSRAAALTDVIAPQKIAAVLRCGTRANGLPIIDVQKALSPTCLALGQTNPGQIRFQQATATVVEDAGAITLTVQRVGGSDGAVRIIANTFDGSATVGQDYPATSLNVDFADGATTQTIAIPIFDDNEEESPETFIVRLGTVLIGQATVTEPSEVLVTIQDNESGTPNGKLIYLPSIQR